MSTVAIKKSPLFRSIAYTVLTAFIGMLPATPSYAQVVMLMPAPGQMVAITRHFEPPQMIGLKVDLKNPFSFNFIMDQGEAPMPDDVRKDEFNKIIKYFLVSLTMPNKDMWVNLSPYESQRIIPQTFAQTEMGRDLLAQDYVLKQFTASLMYPEEGLGKQFWAKIYQEAQERFGTTDISVNTFNKVWIMADKADIYQKGDTAFLVRSHLKVMLEQDYMAIEKNKDIFGTPTRGHVPREAGYVSPSPLPNETALNVKAPQVNNGSTSENVSALGSQIVREIIIPAIEKEVNEGKSFAAVRQAYGAEILATWYKKTLRASLLGQIFADKSKITGQMVSDPKAKEKIYQQYLRAYKKGVFNYIKEDPTPDGQTVPRKYFSGGAVGVEESTLVGITDAAMAENPAARKEVVGFARRAISKSRLVGVLVFLTTLTGAFFINPSVAKAQQPTAPAGEVRRIDGLRAGGPGEVSSGERAAEHAPASPRTKEHRPITLARSAQMDAVKAQYQRALESNDLEKIVSAAGGVVIAISEEQSVDFNRSNPTTAIRFQAFPSSGASGGVSKILQIANTRLLQQISAKVADPLNGQKFKVADDLTALKRTVFGTDTEAIKKAVDAYVADSDTLAAQAPVAAQPEKTAEAVPPVAAPEAVAPAAPELSASASAVQARPAASVSDLKKAEAEYEDAKKSGMRNRIKPSVSNLVGTRFGLRPANFSTTLEKAKELLLMDTAGKPKDPLNEHRQRLMEDLSALQKAGLASNFGAMIHWADYYLADSKLLDSVVAGRTSMEDLELLAARPPVAASASEKAAKPAAEEMTPPAVAPISAAPKAAPPVAEAHPAAPAPVAAPAPATKVVLPTPEEAAKLVFNEIYPAAAVVETPKAQHQPTATGTPRSIFLRVPKVEEVSSGERAPESPIFSSGASTPPAIPIGVDEAFAQYQRASDSGDRDKIIPAVAALVRARAYAQAVQFDKRTHRSIAKRFKALPASNRGDVFRISQMATSSLRLQIAAKPKDPANAWKRKVIDDLRFLRQEVLGIHPEITTNSVDIYTFDSEILVDAEAGVAVPEVPSVAAAPAPAAVVAPTKAKAAAPAPKKPVKPAVKNKKAPSLVAPAARPVNVAAEKGTAGEEKWVIVGDHETAPGILARELGIKIPTRKIYHQVEGAYKVTYSRNGQPVEDIDNLEKGDRIIFHTTPSGPVPSAKDIAKEQAVAARAERAKKVLEAKQERLKVAEDASKLLEPVKHPSRVAEHKAPVKVAKQPKHVAVAEHKASPAEKPEAQPKHVAPAEHKASVKVAAPTKKPVAVVAEHKAPAKVAAQPKPAAVAHKAPAKAEAPPIKHVAPAEHKAPAKVAAQPKEYHLTPGQAVVAAVKDENKKLQAKIHALIGDIGKLQATVSELQGNNGTLAGQLTAAENSSKDLQAKSVRDIAKKDAQIAKVEAAESQTARERDEALAQAKPLGQRIATISQQPPVKPAQRTNWWMWATILIGTLGGLGLLAGLTAKGRQEKKGGPSVAPVAQGETPEQKASREANEKEIAALKAEQTRLLGLAQEREAERIRDEEEIARLNQDKADALERLALKEAQVGAEAVKAAGANKELQNQLEAAIVATARETEARQATERAAEARIEEAVRAAVELAGGRQRGVEQEIDVIRTAAQEALAAASEREAQLREEVGLAEGKLTQLGQKRGMLVEAVKKYRERIVKLKQEVVGGSNADLQQELTNVQTELRDRESKLALLEMIDAPVVQEAEAQRDEAKIKLAVAEEKVRTAEAELAKRPTVEALAQGLEKAHRFETQVTELLGNLATAKDEVQAAQEEARATQDATRAVQEEKARLEAENIRLRGGLPEVGTKLLELEQRVVQLGKEGEERGAKLVEAEQRAADLARKLQEAEVRERGLARELEGTGDELLAELRAKGAAPAEIEGLNRALAEERKVREEEATAREEAQREARGADDARERLSGLLHEKSLQLQVLQRQLEGGPGVAVNSLTRSVRRLGGVVKALTDKLRAQGIDEAALKALIEGAQSAEPENLGALASVLSPAAPSAAAPGEASTPVVAAVQLAVAAVATAGAVADLDEAGVRIHSIDELGGVEEGSSVAAGAREHSMDELEVGRELEQVGMTSDYEEITVTGVEPSALATESPLAPRPGPPMAPPQPSRLKLTGDEGAAPVALADRPTAIFLAAPAPAAEPAVKQVPDGELFAAADADVILLKDRIAKQGRLQQAYKRVLDILESQGVHVEDFEAPLKNSIDRLGVLMAAKAAVVGAYERSTSLEDRQRTASQVQQYRASVDLGHEDDPALPDSIPNIILAVQKVLLNAFAALAKKITPPQVPEIERAIQHAQAIVEGYRASVDRIAQLQLAIKQLEQSMQEQDRKGNGMLPEFLRKTRNAANEELGKLRQEAQSLSEEKATAVLKRQWEIQGRLVQIHDEMATQEIVRDENERAIQIFLEEYQRDKQRLQSLREELATVTGKSLDDLLNEEGAAVETAAAVVAAGVSIVPSVAPVNGVLVSPSASSIVDLEALRASVREKRARYADLQRGRGRLSDQLSNPAIGEDEKKSLGEERIAMAGEIDTLREELRPDEAALRIAEAPQQALARPVPTAVPEVAGAGSNGRQTTTAIEEKHAEVARLTELIDSKNAQIDQNFTHALHEEIATLVDQRFAAKDELSRLQEQAPSNGTVAQPLEDLNQKVIRLTATVRQTKVELDVKWERVKKSHIVGLSGLGRTTIRQGQLDMLTRAGLLFTTEQGKVVLTRDWQERAASLEGKRASKEGNLYKIRPILEAAWEARMRYDRLVQELRDAESLLRQERSAAGSALTPTEKKRAEVARLLVVVKSVEEELVQKWQRVTVPHILNFMNDGQLKSLEEVKLLFINPGGLVPGAVLMRDDIDQRLGALSPEESSTYSTLLAPIRPMLEEAQEVFSRFKAKKKQLNKAQIELEKLEQGQKPRSSATRITPVPNDAAMATDPFGGINLSNEHLILNIKVDGAGMPLPVQFQNQAMMNLNGLTSIIRRIIPITPQNLPELYELVK